MNLVADVLPLDSDAASRQTVAKLQFLTTWEVGRSLRLLNCGSRYPLSVRSREVIQRIETGPLIKVYIADSAVPLRNSLMH